MRLGSLGGGARGGRLWQLDDLALGHAVMQKLMDEFVLHERLHHARPFVSQLEHFLVRIYAN